MGAPKRSAQANTHMQMGYVWRLATLASVLPPKDKKFVTSLIAQFDKGSKLSPKQWYWVGKKLRIANELSVSQGYGTIIEDPDGHYFDTIKPPPQLSFELHTVKNPMDLGVAAKVEKPVFMGLDLAKAEAATIAFMAKSNEPLMDFKPISTLEPSNYFSGLHSDPTYTIFFVVPYKSFIGTALTSDLMEGENEINKKLHDLGYGLELSVDLDIKQQTVQVAGIGHDWEMAAFEEAFLKLTHPSAFKEALLDGLVKWSGVGGVIIKNGKLPLGSKVHAESPVSKSAKFLNVQQVPKKSPLLKHTGGFLDEVGYGVTVEVETLDHFVIGQAVPQTVIGNKTYCCDFDIALHPSDGMAYHNLYEQFHSINSALFGQLAGESLHFEMYQIQEEPNLLLMHVKITGTHIVEEVSKIAYKHFHAAGIKQMLKFKNALLTWALEKNLVNVTHKPWKVTPPVTAVEMSKIQEQFKASGSYLAAVGEVISKKIEKAFTQPPTMTVNTGETLGDIYDKMKKMAAKHKIEVVLGKTSLSSGKK